MATRKYFREKGRHAILLGQTRICMGWIFSSPFPSPTYLCRVGSGLWNNISIGYFDHLISMSCWCFQFNITQTKSIISLQNQLLFLISQLPFMASVSQSSSSLASTFNQLLLHWFSCLLPPHPLCLQTSSKPHYSVPNLLGKLPHWSLCFHPFQSILQTATRLIILKYSPISLPTPSYKTLKHRTVFGIKHKHFILPLK